MFQFVFVQSEARDVEEDVIAFNAAIHSCDQAQAARLDFPINVVP